MTPDISEFSYGFALTHELIAMAGVKLRAAPIFPSLIEEGKKGGGYDVKLDIPGFPLFIQFKRTDCMVRGSARECSPPSQFEVPFYRMKITERSRSAQHDLLLELDIGPNQVFYAAPCFHMINELNHAYLNLQISNRSYYFRPRDIGVLDNESHHIAFGGAQSWLFSEPRVVNGIQGEGFRGLLRQRRNVDRRPVRGGPIDEVLAQAERILRERDISTGVAADEVPGRTDVETTLRRLADLSLRFFSAQLFIVQDAS